jgi:tetratricopeptide (TPR) repeat protein
MRMNSLRFALLSTALLGATAFAQDAPVETPVPAKPQSAAEIGLEFEALRAIDVADRGTRLRVLHEALSALRPEDSTDFQKASRNQLAGEMLLALGEHEGARERLDSAKDGFKDDAFRDDAHYLRILTLEAEGRDEEAAKEWEKWEKKFAGESSLLAEVRIVRMWNALRQGKLELAGKISKQTQQDAPWLLGDSRWLIAEATSSLLAGEVDAALAHLERGATGASASYVHALAEYQNGNSLKAAGFFQEAALRHPDPRVRDYAMLAKANIFLDSRVYRSAIEEFQIVLDRAEDPAVRAEASLRHAASVYMDGNVEAAEQLLRGVVNKFQDGDVAARAQFLLGDVLVAQDDCEQAIFEFNQVLTRYFQHSVAASAQYRVGRCLDALGRPLDATGAYQAVVAGYPLEPEAPAAAYLAGAGLLQQGDFIGAAPYFQIVLDRYTARADADGSIVFNSPEHQELTEAALCLLQLSYHRADRLGQLSGAPHLMLARMPASTSPWRAWTLLIDADALAAQGRHDEAQADLLELFENFPRHEAIAPANQLLAWTYAQQGDDERAIATEERMLRQYSQAGADAQYSTARLHIAHMRFNQKLYKEAANEYEAYLAVAEKIENRVLALYQLGLCYQRLGRSGDAVDRWEQLVRLSPAAETSEKAWARAGDLYFTAGHYDEAARCYRGMLENFAGSGAAATGMLRIAQCAYNAGDDALAVERYSDVLDRFPNSPEGQQAEEGLEVALYRLGQSEGGTAALAQLVERNPTSSFAADAQFQIASKLYDAGEFARAAEEFRRVVSQFPGFVSADRAQFLMADAYEQAGSMAESQSAYEQFGAFFADSELSRTVHFRLGSQYFEQSDFLRTAMEFSLVLQGETRDELSTAALFNLALCQQMLGDFESSASSLTRYREWFPSDERARDVALQLAQLYRDSSRFAEAIAEYKTALEFKTDAALSAELNYEIGNCHEGIAEADLALAAFERSMKSKDRKNPFRLSAVARCAAIYEEKEQYKKALDAYRDLARNAEDAELAAAASERASQLESFAR